MSLSKSLQSRRRRAWWRRPPRTPTDSSPSPHWRRATHWVRVSLPGFTSVRERIRVAEDRAASLAVTMQIDRLSENVDVKAQDVRLETDQGDAVGATFTSKILTELPTASRNYTHVIVAEAGVGAPLPDRTGGGMNLATEPGAQADDAGQSLNPSVNGARPTNNSLRLNGIDTTNLLSASGGLGNNIGAAARGARRGQGRDRANAGVAEDATAAAPWDSSRAPAAIAWPDRAATISSTSA